MSLDPGEPQDKLRGSYRGRRRPTPTRTIEPGERIGSLEVVAAPGHTPGQVALLDTRDRTLYCADAYSTLGGVATTAKPYWRFPLPAWRPGTSRPRSRPPRRCARSTQRGSPRATARWSRRRAPRWTARSRAGPDRGTPRAGPRGRWSTRRSAIADADGLEAVTLARVAAALGVRSPSLYNHVDGRDGLIRAIAARATRELADRAAPRRHRPRGRRRGRRRARAQRAYARAHPGRYAATVAAPAPGDTEHEAAAATPSTSSAPFSRGWARGRRRDPRRPRAAQRGPRLRHARGERRVRARRRPRRVVRATWWRRLGASGVALVDAGDARLATWWSAASPARRRARAGGGRSARAPRRSRLVVQLAPVEQRRERREQRLAGVGQLVLHARRDPRVDVPEDQAVALELAQRRREHAARDAVDLRAAAR